MAGVHEPHVTGARVGASVDPRLAAIARSVRELSRPAAPGLSAGPGLKGREAGRSEQRSDLSLEEVVQHIREVGRVEKASLSEAGHGLAEWKKPVLTLGGLLVAAGICGALAGLSLKGDEAPAQVAVPRAPARIHHHSNFATSAVPSAASPPEALAKAAPRRPASASKPERMNSRTMLRNEGASWAEPGSAQGAASTIAPAENDSEPLDDAKAEGAASTDVAQPGASLPLSRTVIARTIEKIGYPCGTIASASAIAGKTPGTFRVTCSSGSSYRATPVGGRYRFRRDG